MYYQMFARQTMVQSQTVASSAISAEDVSVIIGSLTIYSVSGTSPAATVSLETSDDGEIWANIGTIATGTAVGLSFGNFSVTGTEWGRLVRTKVVISGTDAVVQFALGLNTHASS